MHLFQQHAVKDLAAISSMIPVIDYGPYFAGEPGALPRLAENSAMRARTSASSTP